MSHEWSSPHRVTRRWRAGAVLVGLLVVVGMLASAEIGTPAHLLAAAPAGPAQVTGTPDVSPGASESVVHLPLAVKGLIPPPSVVTPGATGTGTAAATPSPPSATTTVSPTVTPTSLPPGPTFTPSPTVATEEEAALREAGAALRWGWPVFEVRQGEEGPVYTLEQSIMAGASDTMQIAVYPSDDVALIGFGERTGTFWSLPAQRSESASYYASAAHYQDRRSLRFLYGRRVFATATGYNSTVCGGARDPDEIGAALLGAAMEHGLLPGFHPPVPSPTTPCDVPLEVDPVPCTVTEARITVTGTSRAACTVTVEGGSEPVVLQPVDDTFRATLDLRAFMGHRLSAAATCGGCVTTHDVDREGRDMLVYRVVFVTATATPRGPARTPPAPIPTPHSPLP